MSERMTDEEFDKKMDQEEAKSMAGAARFAWREAHRARASETQKDAKIKALQDELDNAHPFEVLHADLSTQLRDAWEATGVAGTVKGLTTLADVVGVTKNDLQEALGQIKALADALEQDQNGKQRSACPSCHIATPGHSKGCNVVAALRLVGRL